MNTTSGTIYFIGEIDALSREISNYVKIGLIRKREGEGARSTANRWYEHAAKQPRDLFIIDEVNTDCVFTVEALIHGNLSKNRVRGEWFHLVGDDVQSAVNMCRDLAKKFNLYSRIAALADSFAHLVSSTEVLDVNDDAIAWAKEHEKSSYIITSSQKERDRLKNSIIDALEKGADIRNIGTMQPSRSSTFNLDGFRQKYPNLYNSYYKLAEKKVLGKFVLLSQPRLIDSFRNDSSLAEFHSLLAESSNALKRYESGDAQITDLKVPYLELSRFKKQAQVDKEIAADYLKSFCGRAGGIDGICSWKRSETSRLGLDREALKKSHPEIFEEFINRSLSSVFVVGAIPNWDDVKFFGDFD